MKEIRGISFPFRIGGKGGVVTTKADLYTSTHLEESLEQIILTSLNERIMEEFGSSISFSIFSPNDEATHTLLKYEIVDAITRYDKRVEVTTDDIELVGDDATISIVINFVSNAVTQEITLKVEIGG